MNVLFETRLVPQMGLRLHGNAPSRAGYNRLEDSENGNDGQEAKVK